MSRVRGRPVRYRNCDLVRCDHCLTLWAYVPAAGFVAGTNGPDGRCNRCRGVDVMWRPRSPLSPDLLIEDRVGRISSAMVKVGPRKGELMTCVTIEATRGSG